jgi:hypothetical protein
VNVEIKRAGGMTTEVPITVLYGFRVDQNIDPERPNRKRYRITALMSCADLPKDKPFGHSCLHGGPPPHTIRVFVKLRATGRPFARTEPRLRQLAREAELLANALRAGDVRIAA